MKRTKLLMVIAGLILATLPANAVRILVTWDFEHCVEDVLEYCQDLNNPVWIPVPGPYGISENQLTYRVVIQTKHEARYLRVRRWWGTPLVSEFDLPPETPENTYQCRHREGTP